ncbi:aminoacyl-tRNA deacylase [Parabacteroides sp. FAFU027]|uniref:aminoacyl-tRNA deacylase n=1 Tax=Parabacteroides sp. FAFU027 TaxID=2922715 RepID=UPI001FAFD171|nr:YbaK/EbsC family protein [Parabacteroides sp. FAFU027]
MPVRKLIEFLRENSIKFVVISHSPAYTALEIAESAHVPGQVLAKTVMVDIDGQLAMAVLPASRMINLELLKESVGAKNVILSCEQEFARRFPGCELGAMPPFGNLFGMEVYVSPDLAEDDEIAFNAGSLSELILLSYKDYVRLVNPKIVKF